MITIRNEVLERLAALAESIVDKATIYERAEPGSALSAAIFGVLVDQERHKMQVLNTPVDTDGNNVRHDDTGRQNRITNGEGHRPGRAL